MSPSFIYLSALEKRITDKNAAGIPLAEDPPTFQFLPSQKLFSDKFDFERGMLLWLLSRFGNHTSGGRQASIQED